MQSYSANTGEGNPHFSADTFPTRKASRYTGGGGRRSEGIPAMATGEVIGRKQYEVKPPVNVEEYNKDKTNNIDTAQGR